MSEKEKTNPQLSWFNVAVTIDRIGRMLEASTHPEVIALQMSINNKGGAKFNINDVEAYGKLYRESKNKALMTHSQTEALIEFALTGDIK